jgi:hypothetical protein
VKKFTRGYFFPLKLEFFARFGFNWMGKAVLKWRKSLKFSGSNRPVIAGRKMTEIVRCAFGTEG